MIVTQSLLTPRLAQLASSWVTGAVLSAPVYAALNITETILAFGTTAQVLLSLAWFMQVAFWGLVKSVTTLRTDNAWMHIATTHTIHLAEAPAVASTFSLRRRPSCWHTPATTPAGAAHQPRCCSPSRRPFCCS